MSDGAIVLDKKDASNRVLQTGFVLDTITTRYSILDHGEYVFKLETVYQGGESSVDYAFIMVHKKAAISKYKLERILSGAIPTHLFIDYDQELKLYTDTHVLHSIVFHRDGVMIDYENKIVYSSEEYSSLKVE